MSSGLTYDRGGVVLSGDLTAATAPKLFAQTPKFGGDGDGNGGADANSNTMRVDLRAVGEVDSAGLALLLHWANCCGGGQLTFTGAPAQLRQMANITGVAALLNLADNDNSGGGE